jgi:signal transduction histidine kinase
MRIRTQCIITMLLFGVISAMIAASAVVTNQKTKKTNEQDRIASSIAQGASELGYLANDYLIYRETRQLKQWQSKFESFSRQVDALDVATPEQQNLARNLKANQRRLKEVFDSIVFSPESPNTFPHAGFNPALLQVSWSRMAVQSQGVISDATQLSQLLREEMDALIQRRTRLVNVMLTLLGLFLLASYFLIYQRILKSIATLQRGTTIIGSGNLDFKLEERKNDEIGDLSRAFNRMTVDVKAVTASKAELEREILERRRAEEALRQRTLELQSLTKSLEQRIQERTSELALRNRELQDFAFVASHDMREPLRKIQSFSDRIRSKYQTLLPEEALDYFARMQNGARRMDEILTSLLAYSRVTTKANTLTVVDLAELVRDAKADLRTEEIGAVVEIGNLPAAEVDPPQIRQVFQNLIQNALKFNASPKPLVRIYGETFDSECRIFVEDNGIGFEDKYLDRIFVPFQRLHGQNDYEGIGMGLAICRKIVERHGGTITARSMPGQGTTFIITLPRKQA